MPSLVEASVLPGVAVLTDTLVVTAVHPFLASGVGMALVAALAVCTQ